MYTGNPDSATFFFYILLGLFFAFIARLSMSKVAGINRYGEPVFKDYWKFAWVGIIVFTFVAVFRKVNLNLGGSDALGYIDWFLRSKQDTAEDHVHGLFTEPLFHLICRFCRTITSDYHFFFLVVYTIITYSYFLFIKKYAPDKLFFIPLLLMVFPYLKSFCTIRSSLAIAFILLGLVIYKKHKILGFITVLSSVFIHRMCIPFIMVIPFLYFFEKKKKMFSKKTFLLFGIAIIVVSFVLISIVQTSYMGLVFGGVDSSYTDMTMEQSTLDSWPRLLPYALLFLGYFFMFDSIKWDKQKKTLLYLFLFDLLMMPIAITFNIWRFNEVFYVVRMLGWGVVIYSFNKKYFHGRNLLVNTMIVAAFLVWLYVRIDHEWDELKIMPYILDII